VEDLAYRAFQRKENKRIKGSIALNFSKKEFEADPNGAPTTLAHYLKNVNPTKWSSQI